MPLPTSDACLPADIFLFFLVGLRGRREDGRGAGWVYGCKKKKPERGLMDEDDNGAFFIGFIVFYEEI